MGILESIPEKATVKRENVKRKNNKRNMLSFRLSLNYANII